MCARPPLLLGKRIVLINCGRGISGAVELAASPVRSILASISGKICEMRLELSEKVEMALRNLAPEAQESARSALEALEHQDPQRNREMCPRLSSSEESEQLLLLSVPPRFRAIFRYVDDDRAVIVEDLVSHAVLERYFKRVYS